MSLLPSPPPPPPPPPPPSPPPESATRASALCGDARCSARLQPYVVGPVTVGGGACNRMWWACNRMWWGLQPYVVWFVCNPVGPGVG